LNQIGALPVKNSAYLLPDNDAAAEDFQWTRRQIEQEGGEAWLFRVEAVAGFTDESLREAFRELRKPDYDDLIQAAARVAGQPTEAEWQKLAQRYSDLRRIDFFDAPGSGEMEKVMNTIDRALHSSPETAARPELAGLSGRTWVTRKGIKVDRTGSAWLIRRWIDPAAKLVFVDASNYTHSPGEVRFDMFEGEFTHDGDLCTFEVLLSLSARRDDPALRAIAEIIHDIDLRDTKYQRAETPGFAAMIDGIGKRHSSDEKRLEDGAALLDSLYASFGGHA
jgi:hypothetical protein